MKIANTKLKKTILIVIGSIIITVTVVILLISPIAKYLLEKYAEKYTGRHIKMSWIYVNPFTGYVHISNLKIYESKSLPDYKKGDSIFFSAKGVSANFAMLKLLSKTIEISEITLDQPKGIVIQNKKELNFTDLIKLFTPKKPRTTPSSVHFTILSIKIENGVFWYREEVAPISYFIKEVNIESTGKRWNADTMAVKFSFSSGPASGSAKGNFTINFKTMNYSVAAILKKYDLKVMEQYMKELVNYGNFSANLDADIKSTGNFNDEEDINLKGLVVLNDFHFGKSPGDDYASCEKLVLKIDELSPKKHQYNFDSLSLTHPFVKYERYDYLDNLQRMFGINGANISAAYADPARFNLILKIVDYIKVLAKNFFQSDYKINRLAIYRGDLKFNDFAISEKFSADINPLFIIADSINRNHKRVNVSLKSGIQPYGYISVNLSINPKDKGDFDLQCHLQKMPASMFNPYLVTYSSYNLDRGTIEFHGIWNVRNGIIQSVNHLVIIDPRVTKRLKNKDTKWLPMPLIMSFIRERGNVIDYEIPITGNLKNPKFHLHDVLMDLLENTFIKPATAPYRLEVKNMETEIEQSHTLKWKMRQGSLLPDQEKFVNTIVDFLINNPDASISVYPMEYAEKEKEHILFFEAKKKYFLLFKDQNALSLNKNDSLKVDKMSVKDSLFVHYLNKKVGGNMLFTIQEKCNKFIGSAIVNAKFKQLNKEREDAFISQFKQKGVQNRLKIYPGENIIPYNGFSYYKITYKGEIPEALTKAYRKMNELNDEAPRKKFKNDRKKNRKAL
jgi:hypothetical protein